MVATSKLKLTSYEKDPNAFRDYSVDRTDWLSGISDTIATSEWIVPSDLQGSMKTFDDHVTTIWITGGTLGCEYVVTSRVTTVGGRIDDRSFILKIVVK